MFDQSFASTGTRENHVKIGGTTEIVDHQHIKTHKPKPLTQVEKGRSEKHESDPKAEPEEFEDSGSCSTGERTSFSTSLLGFT